MPPPDASPAHVVQATIDAVNAGDLEMVRRLGQDGGSPFEIWVETGATMRDAQILQTLSESDYNEYAFYQDAVNVQVSFIPEGTDESMPAGRSITWGFLLTDVSGSWRVFDSGQG
ncbi:hypothetical protein GCM10025875_26990 [Litorihabitans aurantiacus]|uniref:Uncharacterized protein n=2 Tax=Litorihabitans aurantiacus TaxID=1930061 RepID=A0AA37XGW9_9MICO|nr:hypothetical protein GCM10025875_26990 [Litorihabitans aurantiacus]